MPSAHLPLSACDPIPSVLQSLLTQGTEVYELTIEIPFSAAHQIRGHPGDCARLHGHNYRVAVTVSGEQLNDLGMLADFGELKRLCSEVIAPLDHGYLNDLAGFAEVNPTAEAIARYIHRGLTTSLAASRGSPLRVLQVTVFESDRSSATYRE